MGLKPLDKTAQTTTKPVQPQGPKPQEGPNPAQAEDIDKEILANLGQSKEVKDREKVKEELVKELLPLFKDAIESKVVDAEKFSTIRKKYEAKGITTEEVSALAERAKYRARLNSRYDSFSSSAGTVAKDTVLTTVLPIVGVPRAISRMHEGWKAGYVQEAWSGVSKFIFD